MNAHATAMELAMEAAGLIQSKTTTLKGNLQIVVTRVVGSGLATTQLAVITRHGRRWIGNSRPVRGRTADRIVRGLRQKYAH